MCFVAFALVFIGFPLVLELRSSQTIVFVRFGGIEALKPLYLYSVTIKEAISNCDREDSYAFLFMSFMHFNLMKARMGLSLKEERKRGR